MTRRAFRQTLTAYLFLLPALVVWAIFTFMPVMLGTGLSFFQYDVISPPEFIGLENFRQLMGDRYFWIAASNSFKYLAVVPVLQFLSILLALLVNQKLKGISWFRAAYYIPVITSMAVVGIVWRWLYEPEGIINYLLLTAGLVEKPVSWLGNPDLALYSVMFVTLWKGLGYYMVIYLAGLQAIPKEYEEAAVVDGASRAQVFWRVTIPLLKPSILVASTISALSAIKVFEEIYVMTGGGPMFRTLTLFFYAFDKGFQQLELGYAAAIMLALASVVMILSAFYFRIMRRGGVESW